MAHPYKTLPDRAFWRRSVTDCIPSDIDPVGTFDLKITPTMKVATAGSCFAQHIARHLRNSGYNYYIAEAAHSLIPEHIAEEHGYGLYSARYGNVYTTRQLLQLIERAYGRFTPREDIWTHANGSVIDPFRPSVQPGGFASEFEMRGDREWHLSKVREMLENLDVFVFTLGLTECWKSSLDGAVFPIAPGVDGGAFDAERHIFQNLTVQDVVEDLSAVVRILRDVNPSAQILLTVSPVPLAATAQTGAHVLAATTYSKSVLRVAADVVSQANGNVHYFPSYEIITSSASRGRYFATDLRNVTEEGVDHVMRLVLKHATCGEPVVDDSAQRGAQPSRSDVDNWLEVMCDEEALDPSTVPGRQNAARIQRETLISTMKRRLRKFLRVSRNIVAPAALPAHEAAVPPGDQAQAEDDTPRIKTKWLDLPYVDVDVRDRTLRYATTGSSSVKRVRTIFTKEPTTLAWIDGFGESETLFDIGANVGMYTVYAAVMKKATIYAFEPESLNYAELNKNIYLNDCHDNVIAYCLALSDVDKTDRLLLSDFGVGISYHDFEEDSWTGDKAFSSDWIVKKEGRRQQGCIGRRIDSLIQDGIPVPDHIKIDVDGLEHRVIGGMLEVLKHPNLKTVLIEINFDDPRNLEIISTMEELGWRYSFDQISCNRNTKFTQKQIDRYQREQRGGLNYIFFKDEKWADYFSEFEKQYVPGDLSTYSAS